MSRSSSGSLPVIRAESLSRSFGRTRAVDSLTLQVGRGEIFGLVGPDGAGKTTTLRLLAGLLTVTDGAASVAGFDLTRQAESVKPLVGYMAQQFSLYGELSVEENLAFFADLYQVTGELRTARVERLLSFARLEEFRHRRAVHLSGGMQKKLALACTLIHEPAILLLDEPTTGVDPISRREFWDILTQLHLDGTTIVVSTPYMDEAERCSRVGLLYQGRLVIQDEPRRIRSMIEGELVALQSDDWRAARLVLGSVPGVLEVQTYGETLRLYVDSAERRIPEIQAALRSNEVEYRGLRRAPSRLEDAFVSLIRRMED